jgi:AcrR family transcriptional regulator
VSDGLRERKKRATRLAILAAAQELFAEQGFDAVTVAEVAAAADVSEKTVFNHFATKEDLVLAGGDERRARLIEAVRTRPPGTPVLELFRAESLELVDMVARGETAELLAVPRMVRASKTLQERLFLGWEREATELAPAIAEAAGARDDDIVPMIIARTLAWTHRMIFRAAIGALLTTDEDPKALARRLRRDANRAYDQLAEGLASYGAE